MAFCTSMHGGRPAPVVFGCAGPALLAEEATFFRAVDPLGFILFARNIVARDQLFALIADLRASVGRSDAPVLIDQEGGRVARLKPPLAYLAPPLRQIGALAERAPEAGERAAWLHARRIAADLAGLGITVDCAPVLDLAIAGAHDIIGDRAYGGDPKLVARLGQAACAGFLAGGVTPVIKHLPGHGRALADSHLELPKVDLPLAVLADTDFLPFRAVAAAHGSALWAMTAHILYPGIDPIRPATCSPTIVAEILRGQLGQGGVLVSDDLSMRALTGGFAERAAAALDAGCDLVLHCNGDMAEMQAVADGLQSMGDATVARLASAEAARLAAQGRDAQGRDADPHALEAELAGLLSTAAV